MSLPDLPDQRVAAFLREAFLAAVAAADPARVVPGHLPPPPAGRTVVVGAGKASAAMAVAVEAHWPPDAPLSGLVITRHGQALPTRRIRVVEAGHPLPDEFAVGAAKALLSSLRRLTADDLVLGLVSGGGSSLLTLPAAGLALGDVRQVAAALLTSGAPVQEMNVVRKHLTMTLGGQLALAAAPAHVCALIISDVTGDDPGDVASGPFAPDRTTFADALSVLRRYHVDIPNAVCAHIEHGMGAEISDTPKPGHPAFAAVDTHIIASGRTALDGARTVLARDGIRVVDLGDSVTGEARAVAAGHARRILGLQRDRCPVALLSGGETTVTVLGNGCGGRNSEYALALAFGVGGAPGIFGLAADTDGWDGTGDHAGAWFGPDTLRRGAAAGVDAWQALDANDSRGFFATVGGLVTTGPTGTNVNDFRLVLAL